MIACNEDLIRIGKLAKPIEKVFYLFSVAAVADITGV